MSTKLPTYPDPAPVAEPLTVLLESATRSVLRSLTARLAACGFDGVTPSHLVLFGNLDCGTTHAARIATRMGVSRQATSKTLRELQDLGLVRLDDDPDRGNQKLVILTDLGMQLAQAARRELALIEAALAVDLGPEAVLILRRALVRAGVGPGEGPAG